MYKRQVPALDQACPPQYLFDLIGLQMADKVAGLTAVSSGIVVCAQYVPALDRLSAHCA